MRRVSTILSVSLCSLLCVSISLAQQKSTVATTSTSVPNLIRYSGTLKDAPGADLASTTPIGVTFSIYNQQDGGAAVWQETQNVAPDANGQYSVLLGSITATGLPDDLFSQQEQRWLGVQVQGQEEQARILLVSVPYALKAHEADTVGGRSASDFVLANGATTPTNSSQASSSTANNLPAATAGIRKGAASAGPTNFSGSTTDQIVGVTQSGTGAGVISSAPSKALVGTATSTSGTAIGVEGGSNGSGGYGVYGNVTSSTGATVGVKGNSQSSAGTGVRGTNIATSGATTGVSGYVNSAAGTAGSFNNAAGGMILSGQNNGVVKFSVDGLGNVNSVAGTYQIAGGSVVSIGAPGDRNLFLGAEAGFQNVAGSGQENTFSGYQAGYGNTSGQGNTFSGIFAGRNNATASYNTFTGLAAGETNTGSYNAFFGYEAGVSNASGGSDTFYGAFAGASNTTACCNVFTGYKSGYSTTTGGFNVFSGWKAGYSNTLGKNNTFDGYQAGYSNTGDSSGDGSANAFFGYQAGYSNTIGFYNTFAGYEAGYSNTGDTSGYGCCNAFFGYEAGYHNTLGQNNAFVGYQAGLSNTSGNANTFLGQEAGAMNTTGSYNVFIGDLVGPNNTTGSNNTYINASGPLSGNDNNAIRIGDIATAAYIGGIYFSTSSSGIPVYVNSNGQLGTQTSSLRFKEQIRDMGDSTTALMKLRPVTFLYKPEYANGDRALQYGLIAEEVAQVYPELVAYDNDGQPYSVRYQYLSTMLLNEVQKQHLRAEHQSEIVTTQRAQIRAQQQEIETLKLQLQLQNATLQERLSRLEKLAGTQTVAQK